MATRVDDENTVVWQAVGVLAAVQELSLGEALGSICARGVELRVRTQDVAEFVLWRGHLPD